jgi:hypothetical protein
LIRFVSNKREKLGKRYIHYNERLFDHGRVFSFPIFLISFFYYYFFAEEIKKNKNRSFENEQEGGNHNNKQGERERKKKASAGADIHLSYGYIKKRNGEKMKREKIIIITSPQNKNPEYISFMTLLRSTRIVV